MCAAQVQYEELQYDVFRQLNVILFIYLLCNFQNNV